VTEEDLTAAQRREYYANRRSERAHERRAARPRATTPYIALGVAGVLLLLVAAEVAASYARIHPGVSVSGVDVGGMVPEKAALVLSTELPRRSARPVTVTHEGDSWQVTAEQVGLTFNYNAVAEDAMDVGRSGGLFRSTGARLGSWFGGTELSPVAHATAPAMSSVVATIAAETDVAPIDARVVFEGSKPRVVPAEQGRALDRSAASRAIVAAMLSSDRTVAAPVGVARVVIDDAEAEKAASQARQLVSAPVTITYKEHDWEFAPKEIVPWIAFVQSRDGSMPASVDASGANVGLVARVSAEKTKRSITKRVGSKLGRKPRDARFSTSNGSVTIVPSRDGVGPDLEALASELTSVLSDPAAQRRVVLKTALAQPKLTTEDAREMGIKKRIGVYTTTYSAGNRPRVNNIHQLGDALDGTLVAPGETFSFNKSVGPRTAAKGYQEAPAIVNGKLVPQLGGGICQVGTTIFNAVFTSGLPVVQRQNHSFYISHYPKGRDATVSWGGPDFKFKNDTDKWVLVSVSYSSSSITIALYGTDPGYEVESETSSWRNIRPFPVEEIKDKTILKGSKAIEDRGVDGKTITVKRIVTKDGKVVRTDSFVSVYRPKAQVVRVGTKKVPTSTTATDTPKP
jgi:vancomycin resistance protein YoaR